MFEQSPITLSSPLDKSTDEFLQGLIFRSMTAREELGRPFEYRLELLSTSDSLDIAGLLAKSVSVRLELNVAEGRFFNGFVTDFGLVGSVGEFALYEATVRPWLWFLTQATNCRIFQSMNVPDIVADVCRKYGFTDIDATGLSGNYVERNFVVQYSETDFNFVSRLLEEEGIYYFFKHEESKHTLVLADSLAPHEATPGCESLPYRPAGGGGVFGGEHIDSWKFGQRVMSDAYAVKDFDFERPTAPLLSHTALSEQQRLEVFDYAGAYLYQKTQDEEILQRHNEDPRDTYARVRLEELTARAEQATGRTNARQLLVGALLTLTEFPRADQNRQYLITGAMYELHGHGLRSEKTSEQLYRCTFDAQDVKRVYRPRRTAAKPRIMGPQTATVVGKDGEEIWTDEYGRVKILFPWDRFGSGVEDSSCWVRVAQVWAGAKMGAIHIPRMGDEVIVEFLEGDPDRPIITGRVYNKDNMPPYDLPANQTQSGIKSRSTKGGQEANANEIRFEDKKGQEEFATQAERNYTELVKNDKSVSVKANRSTSIGGNDTLSVTGNRTITIDGNLSLTVKGKGKAEPGKPLVHSTQSVTGKHSLDASDTIEITAPTHIKLTVAGSSIMILPGSITLTAGDGSSVTLNVDALVKSNAGSQVKLDAKALMQASNGGAQVELDPNVLVASNGGSQLTLKADAASMNGATATVGGTNAVDVNSGTKVALTGGASSIELSGGGAAMSGPKASVSGSGVTEITGALVKIN
jgi:type VI secretion system secreted protein VgrG